MTAFTLPTFDDPFKLAGPVLDADSTIRPPRKVRQVATDTAIHANRTQTPPDAVDERAVKRLSVAEMNALDMPTLMDRYKAQRYDDRGAVTRFLDLLDLPRNAILSTVAPSIRRRKEAEGDVGTFGLGNVRFSDVLDEMGVENRIIRGVVGFVGDVALDPLTYAGPAGWGGKIAGTGGKAIEITAEGRRALNAAVKSAARGRSVGDAAASNVLRAFGFGEEALAANRASKSVADLEKEIRAGIYGSQTTANKVGSAIGLDLQTRGSALADAFHSAERSAQSEAAREFVKQYGRGSAKGFRLGKSGLTRVGAGTDEAAGSYLAHIPFTSYGLFVPSFTGPAMQAASILDRANAGFSEANEALGESVGAIRAFRDQAENLTRGVRDGTISPDDAKSQIGAIESGLSKSVFEDGLNPAAPQNRLKTVADVMKQHAEWQKASAALAELQGASRETIESVAKRKALIKTLGIDAKVSSRLDEAAALDPEAFDAETARKAFFEEELQNAIGTTDASGRRALDDAQVEILNTPMDQAEVMESLADALHAEIQARGQYANAIHGTLTEAMKATENSAIARVASELMGAGVEVGGLSMFDTARNALRRAGGDDNIAVQTAMGKIDAMGEAARRAAGGPDGEAKRLMRTVEAQTRNLAEQAHRSVYEPMIADIKASLSRHGIDPDRWREASDAATALQFIARDPKGEYTALDGAELFGVLERAKKAGLGPAFDDLTAIAQKYQGLNDQMTDAERLAFILGTEREAYLYGPATREGAQFFRGLKQQQEAGSLSKNVPLANFNIRRLTDKAQWVGADGSTRNLYQWVHDYYASVFMPNGTLRGDALDTLRSVGVAPDEAFWNALAKGDDVSEMLGSLSPIERLVYDTIEYNSLPAAVRAGVSKFKQVDPFTKNREIPGLFSMLMPSQKFPRGMFETSLADLQAQRTAAHEAAYIRDSFNKILGQYGQPLLKMQGNGGQIASINAMPYGAEVRFSNGSTGRIVKEGGDAIVEIGGNRYRRLRNKGEVAQALRQFGADVYGPESIDILYPIHVAEKFERLAEVSQNPAPVMAMYDGFLRAWKGLTLAHPSWIIGDMIGGLFQSLMGGAKPGNLAKRMRDGIRLAMASDKPDLLRSLTADLHGLTPEQFVKEVGKMNGISGHAHGVPVAEMLAGGVELPGYTGKSAEAFTKPGEFFPTRAREMQARAAARMDASARAMAMQGMDLDTSKVGKTVKKAGFYKNLLWDELVFNHVLKPFFSANARANDAIRIATILAFMDDGHDLAGATHKAVEALFDVSDLTKFETATLKRLLPFYSWMKHSGVHWTRRMLESPALLSIAPRVQRAIEESMYGDQTVPQHMRPNWMRDQLAFQIGADPDSRYALTLGTLLPTETATAVGAAAASPAIGIAGIKQLAEQVGFGLSLPIKMLVESASGREMFSGREIGFNPDQGDLTYGEYLTSQIRPLREFGIGNIRQGPIQKAAEAGAVPLASRLALGGRSQPFDDDRVRQNLLREYKQAEQGIRKRITIANREGNTPASVEARARLLRLYTEMTEKGLDDEVPAWARKQLAQVRSG